MSTELEKQIKDLNKTINSRDEEIQNQLINLGRQIYADKETAIPTGDLKDPYTQAKQLEKTIPELEKQKQTIKKKMDRLDAISEKFKIYKNEIKNLDERMESFYIEIGKAAYTSFKEAQTPPQDLREIFEDLEKSDDKIRNIDNDLYQINKDDDANFFTGIIQKGKSVILNTRRKSISGTRVSQYKKAGEAFCQTPYFEESAKKELQELAAPYMEIRDQKQEILENSGKLSLEEEKIKEELQEICNGKSYRKALNDLDKKIEDTHRSIDEALHFLGDLFFHKPKKPYKDKQEVKDRLKTLKDLTKDNEQDNRKITILQAKIDIIELSSLKERKSKRINELEDQIELLQKSINNLQNEINQLDKDIADKRTITAGE